MRLRLFSMVAVLACSPLNTSASDFLDTVCGSSETKAYCMTLLQGFLSGYNLGYHNGTHNAKAAPDERGPELCVPYGVKPADLYEDIRPHLPEGLGVLDMSLFVGALKAYPCEDDGD